MADDDFDSPLPLEQRLRKRERREKRDESLKQEGESSSSVSASLEAASVAKRRKSLSFRAKLTGEPSSPPSGPQCCLKSCGEVIDSQDSARVEVKAGLLLERSDLDAFLSGYLVGWNPLSGEAQFHGDCWARLEKGARARSRRGELVQGMSKGEKALVKEAAKTAEWHDSEVVVNHEASRIAGLLKCSTHCIAFTGAGISTSAGIGDYRGKDGKWTEMDRALTQERSALEKEKDDSEEVETEDEGVPYENLRPTYTHEALMKLIEMGFLKHVISQNGDGLHGLSGIPPEHLSELHGNVFFEICEKCSHRYYRPYYVMDDAASLYYEEIEDFGATSVRKPKHAKKCELCGLSHRTGRRCEQAGCKGYLKDSIINFRDNLEEDILTNAEMHAKKADLCLSFGTTMQVTPACDLVSMGRKPLRLVIVNRQKTDLDHIACECLPPSDSHTQLGSRVHGDADRLMRALMQHMMPESELLAWQAMRAERMKQYDHMRTSLH